MIIQFARIFNSSVYHDDPFWVMSVKQMIQWDEEKTQENLHVIIENSSYIRLTPAVYKELQNVLTVKDVAGFFTLFDALRYPIFSASLISVMLHDVDFLKELIKQLSSQQMQRPKLTMALLRDRWMTLVAETLENEVIKGELVHDGITKPMDGVKETQLLDDLKEMIGVLGAENMFRWAIEIKCHRAIGEHVWYNPDFKIVAYNRLRLFVLNNLPNLVNLNAMKTNACHLPYTLYLLDAFVNVMPTNIAKIEELIKDVFDYLRNDTSPTCTNDELDQLLIHAAKAYALCKNHNNNDIISLIDSRRVNSEGWRVSFHHKPLVDDDINTDIIRWPEHFMPREQQEMMAFRMALYLLKEGSHFITYEDKVEYYEAIAKRLFSHLRTLDGNDFRVDSYGFNNLMALAYKQTVDEMPNKVEWFLNQLMECVDSLYDLFMFLNEGEMQLKLCHQQKLGKRYNADWGGERKVLEILNLYDKHQLDAVESELKNLIESGG